MSSDVAEGAATDGAYRVMKTLVCLSGGLDSAVVLAMFAGECEAVAFDYAQPHRIELERAREIAKHYGVALTVIAAPYMPRVNDVVFAGRNLVFTAMAVSHAQAKGFDAVAFGCNASDWPRFPDCRPAFWMAMESIGGAYGVRVITPLIYHSKVDVVTEARRLGVPIELTWSCYAPTENNEPCGKCLACVTRDGALAT